MQSYCIFNKSVDTINNIPEWIAVININPLHSKHSPQSQIIFDVTGEEIRVLLINSN